MNGSALRTRRVHVAALCAATLVCLLPFLGKPFHMDDPLFVWTARHIHVDPLDFYGFDLNWHGFVDTMASVNKNPPLVPFYLAFVAALFGWSEVALHAGMLLPAVAAVLGVYFLARRLCAHPLIAGAVAISTPAFLVSSSSVMVDVSMLALWCWAVTLWVEGLEDNNRRKLAAAGTLVGLAILTKYFAITLIPLLFAYLAAKERGIGRRALHLLIPLAMIATYQGYMWVTYGQNPFGEVAAYALESRASTGTGLALKLKIGLLFLGGSFFSALFYAPLLWSRRTLAIASGAFGLTALFVANSDAIGLLTLRDADGVRWSVVAQVVLSLACAVQVFALAAVDLERRRDASAVLLSLWLVGVFVFAAFINWTLNARVLLPALPAVAILIARRIADHTRDRTTQDPATEDPATQDRAASRPALLLALPGLAVALAVTLADARHATSARAAAAEIAPRYQDAGTLWFQGAWGFQYYMEAAGAQRVDGVDDVLAPGDVLVTPQNNTNLFTLPAAAGRVIESAEFPVLSWITTQNEQAGAGFHSDRWGPLPFIVGSAPRETYRVYAIRAFLQLHGTRRGGSK